MPGSFVSVFLVAFDRDQNGHTVRAFRPQMADSEAAALAQARELAERHAGVVVWKRVASPAVGEEGEPEIVYQTGILGDFN
jgi:hypothetical protein